VFKINIIYSQNNEKQLFKKGSMQLGLGVSFADDEQAFSSLFGYFFTDFLVSGIGMSVVVPQDNANRYEPSIWSRAFLNTKGGIYPYLSISAGYLFSNNYKYNTENRILETEIDDPNIETETFHDNLKVIDITPGIGILILASQNIALDIGIEYVNLYPLDDEPRKGYRVKHTKHWIPVLSLSLFIN
jgi:hypothetical protein